MKPVSLFLASVLSLNLITPAYYVLAAEEPFEISEEEESFSESGVILGSEAQIVRIYRLYNPYSGEHFYTDERNECLHLTELGWAWEGTGWYGPSSSSAPVYRLYNPNAGDHHYTMNAKERDHLKKVGWKYEGIGWYSDDSKTVKVLRQYNPNARTGSHNFTTSANEDAALKQSGWHQEGVGWYASKLGQELSEEEAWYMSLCGRLRQPTDTSFGTPAANARN